MKAQLLCLLPSTLAAALIVCAAAPGTALAQPPEGTYHQVHSFTADEASRPQGRLRPLTDGSLVGTSVNGGSHDFGTVYVLKPGSHSVEVLHSFGGRWKDGAYPYSGVIADGQGNLWGTTGAGGVKDYGTIYRITNGRLKVVHMFGSDPFGTQGPGRWPMAELTLASNGMLYGTTSDSVNLGGTVFRLEADGSVTNLWDFGEDNPFDPAASYARLLQASDGLLYGTTSAGGAASEGTIFSLDLDGSVRRILHSFSLPGPRIPKGGVIEASDGHLYGTTSQGGAHDVGTVYRIDREGSNFTTLHVFSKHRDDGAEPLGELVETSPGVFVGTTALGGKANAGTVFQMLATGEFTVLYSFTGSLGAGEPSLDGAMPQATLTPVNGTTLFGVTARGGAEGIGTVFKLSAP